MDFITHLPVSSEGYEGIFTVVDRFSKMVKVIPLHESTSALEVAKLFFENIVRTYGLPHSIVSDRDSRFVSKFWTSLLKMYNITP
jgi:hypothetical protein